MNTSYFLSQGDGPLLVSMPHDGTRIPEEIGARMTGAGRSMPDTDWHVSRLYGFLSESSASVLQARYSRYVVDLNRPPDDASLYPGQDVTGLCPITSFDRDPIYQPGEEPDVEEIEDRVSKYWLPYHRALADELDRIRSIHGVALLWDAHSIRSQVPRFFAGRLPDFNLGTADGATCCPGVVESLSARVLEGGYSVVANGRFKGGYITRRYGDPAHGVHALQLELSQITYMDEAPPFTYQADRASRVAPVIQGLMETFVRCHLGP